MFLQIEYQPNIHQRQWYDMRIAIFTEIRRLVEKLITFSCIFELQKLCNLTAKLNKSLSTSTWMKWEDFSIQMLTAHEGNGVENYCPWGEIQPWRTIHRGP